MNREKVFVTDKQTLDDLNILGKFKSKSIFSIYNATRTQGGERLLEKLFREPLTSAKEINNRAAVFANFQQLSLEFPVDDSMFSEMESYLKRGSSAGALRVISQATRRRSLFLLGLKEEYNHAMQGLVSTLSALKKLKTFLSEKLANVNAPELANAIGSHLQTLQDKRLGLDKLPNQIEEIHWMKAINYERVLQGSLSKKLEQFLDFCHWLDVNIAVGTVAKANNFTQPVAKENSGNSFDLVGGYHPAVPNAVSNDVSMGENGNLIFLTGANMAGKSTIMKTIGVNYYLGHMGFPVPATSMEFSVKQGVYTSINVPDNLDMGYSHFYAEVLRVKNVAAEVASGKDLLVIFDELFKGTNVKDAFDATLAVSEAFSAYTNCLFIISTHIVEVGVELGKVKHDVQFKYMPTVMDGNEARYPYKVADGISDDRHGMMIIKNEKILDIIA